MRGCLLWIIVFLIFCIPLILWLVWSLEPSYPVNFLIYDKSVANYDRKTHAGFFWLLDYLKYPRRDMHKRDLAQDFYGFQPLDQGKYLIRTMKGKSQEELEAIARSNDGFFALDALGVRREQWFRSNPGDDESPFLDGGFNEADIELIRLMKEAGKPIFLESTIFSPNMPVEERWELESVLGVQWSGWRGRCYQSLDPQKSPDIPKRWMRLWEEQNGAFWRFTNPGIILISEKDDVVVLAQGKHLNLPFPTLRTNLLEKMKYGMPVQIPFPGSFEIINPVEEGYSRVSRFELSVSVSGDSLLSAYRIPRSFPALLTRKGIWISAGDFTSYCPPDWMAHVDKIDNIMNTVGRFHRNRNPYDTKRFFFEYYCPIMKQVLKESYHAMPVAKVHTGK